MATRATGKLAGTRKVFVVANQALGFEKKAADKMREYAGGEQGVGTSEAGAGDADVVGATGIG